MLPHWLFCTLPPNHCNKMVTDCIINTLPPRSFCHPFISPIGKLWDFNGLSRLYIYNEEIFIFFFGLPPLYFNLLFKCQKINPIYHIHPYWSFWIRKKNPQLPVFSLYIYILYIWEIFSVIKKQLLFIFAWNQFKFLLSHCITYENKHKSLLLNDIMGPILLERVSKICD